MKALLKCFGLSLLGLGACSANDGDVKPPSPTSQWVLTWSEEFNGPELDKNVWVRCQPGPSDWNKHMSLDPSLVEMRDGNVVLKGMVNPDKSDGALPYITGGICTKGRKWFRGGKIEIRAKFQSAQGAWPALWMLPFDVALKWPSGGEIDIMERLNFDKIVHQTVHSTYTKTISKANPVSSMTAPINPDDYNVYGVEVDKSKVTFYVNGKKTFSYPCVDDGNNGQYPFMNAMYLIMDMQLGGSWVGEVDMSQLPVEMEIDWVRYYTRK